MDNRKEILKKAMEHTLNINEDSPLQKAVLQAMQIYANQQLRLYNVSKSLPTKKYEIDFGGNVLAGLEIINNKPTVIGAMNGWGNGISKDKITITEK